MRVLKLDEPVGGARDGLVAGGMRGQRFDHVMERARDFGEAAARDRRRSGGAEEAAGIERLALERTQPCPEAHDGVGDLTDLLLVERRQLEAEQERLHAIVRALLKRDRAEDGALPVSVQREDELAHLLARLCAVGHGFECVDVGVGQDPLR